MEKPYISLTEEAWHLVHSIAVSSESQDGLGTMSPAAYDTAWVAMTEKNGQTLFPEAYEYLKATQSPDGSWAAETSDADGIINTLAALLALKRQERRYEEVRADNERRCQAAEESLRRMLAGWDLDATDRVGMEVLVPNLLRLLEAEGISFTFPCHEPLMKLNSAKLARLGPILTSPVQTTLIHTLEAFVEGGDLHLDFDKVRQHKMPNGSMLASPSSTAAYLMNASEWDLEAEEYLKSVAKQMASKGEKGGFPSAFPSTIFEISWVLDTLLEAGFDKDDFLLADIRKLTVMLETNLKANKGIVGWAPGCLPDADDTAKTISVLRMLGWEHEVEPMLKSFEVDSSFLTYRGERNASSSANCNILLCLLRAPEPRKYTGQIVKCVKFLSKTWMRNNGPDKWHTSVQYPMMLIAQAFMLFLKRWGKKDLDMEAIPSKVIYQDIPRTLLDILSRTMRAQYQDGSWEDKREVTAYAILTLAPLLSLPWVDFLKPEGIACMYRGKAYLENNRSQWRNGERIWIEKTVYASSNLSQAYCLAASKIVVPVAFVSESISNIFPAQLSKKMAKMTSFFSQVIPFSGSPKWKLQLSLLQSAQYTVSLKEARHNVFPTIEKASDEKYQEYIPFTWIGCRDILSTGISAEAIWDMMLVSLFNFQVDAYMETTVWDAYKDRLPELKALVRSICTGTPGKRKRLSEDDAVGTPKKVSRSNGAVHDKSDDHLNGDSNGHPNSISSGRGHIEANGNRHVNGARYRADSVLTNGSKDNSDAEGIELKNGVDKRVNGSNSSTVMSDFAPNGEIESHSDPKQSSALKEGPPKGLESKLQENSRAEVKEVLTKFVNFALQHPKVVKSPTSLRTWLAQELQTFLLAHITHMEDCAAMSGSNDFSKGTATWSNPRTTFFNWVRTTSADHTSCPYSFVFFLCLIGETGNKVVSSVHQRYALEDACRHLATMCRQYNDFGSVVRDHDEKNLNSVNFPEFQLALKQGSSTTEIQEQNKRDLLGVAEYERRCLNRVVSELEETMDMKVMEKLRLFIQVTDLYGHIYVARDIGIRREAGAKGLRP